MQVSHFAGMAFHPTPARHAAHVLNRKIMDEQLGAWLQPLINVPCKDYEAYALSTNFAGAGCDGQVLVIHDMLGLCGPGTKVFKFAKRYT